MNNSMEDTTSGNKFVVENSDTRNGYILKTDEIEVIYDLALESFQESGTVWDPDHVSFRKYLESQGVSELGIKRVVASMFDEPDDGKSKMYHIEEDMKRIDESMVAINEKFDDTMQLVKEYSEDKSCFVWDNFIPDDADENTFYAEMTEIYPRYNQDHNIRNGFKVCVFEGKEGNIPHVHVYYNNKGNENHEHNKTVAHVCLASAEYAPQHKKDTKILNSKEKENLIEYFITGMPNRYAKDENGNFYQIVCWQECVQHWIDENPGSEKLFKVDEETGLYVMPDYSKL